MHMINPTVRAITGWFFGILFLVIGVLNLIYVHPVPGIVYILLSLAYLPPVAKKLGFSIPFIAKVIVGLVVLWWTLGVSDLADMLGL